MLKLKFYLLGCGSCETVTSFFLLLFCYYFSPKSLKFFEKMVFL